MNTHKKGILLMVLGLFVISISQIINHFLILPDFLNGTFIGMGIAILLLALKTIGKINTAYK